MKWASFKRFGSPWFYGYGFQGIVVLGIVPILMPLIVSEHAGASTAGLVVASFYVGQLLGPLVGMLSDRFALHKPLYLSGFVLLGGALVFFPYVQATSFWLILAFLQGFGSVASNTVAGIFIVERYEKSEWDERIGVMQTLYGVGQAIGLAAAAVLFPEPAVAYLLAAALMIPGMLVGYASIPSMRKQEAHPKLRGEFEHKRHLPFRSPMVLLSKLELSFHQAILKIPALLTSRFGLFIVGWFFIMLGNWLLYNLYPLLMRSVFDMDADVSSVYNALGAIIGIFLYAPAGMLGEKIGDGKVVLAGILASLLAVGLMAFFAYFNFHGLAFFIGGLAFVLIPASWSPLIVGGTSWSAELSSLSQGEALGIFNSTTALACVISALGAGYIAEFVGYKAILLVSLAFTVLSLFVILRVMATDAAPTETEESVTKAP
ncbi:MFS transporter [Hydrogenovibrio thermophilus]|nr:MFS transporter [Hydrogenovibrio thermophilus]